MSNYIKLKAGDLVFFQGVPKFLVLKTNNVGQRKILAFSFEEQVKFTLTNPSWWEILSLDD